MDYGALLIELASKIGAFSTVMGAVFVLYKRYVQEPDKRMKSEISKDNERLTKDAIGPLISSIERLNGVITNLGSEIIEVSKGVKTNNDTLHNHNVRISKLEMRNEMEDRLLSKNDNKNKE